MSINGTIFQCEGASQPGIWPIGPQAYVSVASNSVCTFHMDPIPDMVHIPNPYADTTKSIRRRRWTTKRPTTNEVLRSIRPRRLGRQSKSPSSPGSSRSDDGSMKLVVVAVEETIDEAVEETIEGDKVPDLKNAPVFDNATDPDATPAHDDERLAGLIKSSSSPGSCPRDDGSMKFAPVALNESVGYDDILSLEDASHHEKSPDLDHQLGHHGGRGADK